MSEPRYMRQMLVAEIGEAGQRRIERGVAAVAGEGLAHEVAAAYAQRAGFGAVAPGAIDVDALAPTWAAADPAARAVLAGSRAALAATLLAARAAPNDEAP